MLVVSPYKGQQLLNSPQDDLWQGANNDCGRNGKNFARKLGTSILIGHWFAQALQARQVSIAAFTSCEKSYSPRHFCTLLRKRSTSAVSLTGVL